MGGGWLREIIFTEWKIPWGGFIFVELNYGIRFLIQRTLPSMEGKKERGKTLQCWIQIRIDYEYNCSSANLGEKRVEIDIIERNCFLFANVFRITPNWYTKSPQRSVRWDPSKRGVKDPQKPFSISEVMHTGKKKITGSCSSWKSLSNHIFNFLAYAWYLAWNVVESQTYLLN